MRKTIIYFFIALSLVSLGLTLVPQAFSQIQNIKIINYSYYLDNLGNLDVVGEVQNVGSNTVNPVILTGSVYSSNGVDQANSFPAQAFVSYLTPQQEAPFYMQFPQPKNSPDGTWYSLISTEDISVTFTVTQAEATSSYQYPDLKIISSSAAIGTSGDYNGAYLVSGVIQNTGSQTATNLTVVGAFFNSTGTVVGVGYTNYLTPTTLAPSGNVSFQISALDLNQSQVPPNEKITSYSLLVQTGGPILQGTAPIATPYQANGTSSTSPSPSSSPSSTPKSGSSNNAYYTAIIAAALIVIIVIGAGAILRLSKRKTNKKATRKAKTNTLSHASRHL